MNIDTVAKTLGDPERFKRLDQAVVQAAKRAGLPEPAMTGFDGESWIWSWAKEVPSAGKGIRAEVRVAVRPELLRRGYNIDVSAGSWTPVEPNYASSSKVETRFVDGGPGVDPASALGDFHTVLEAAWKIALSIAQQLEEFGRWQLRSAQQMTEADLET